MAVMDVAIALFAVKAVGLCHMVWVQHVESLINGCEGAINSKIIVVCRDDHVGVVESLVHTVGVGTHHVLLEQEGRALVAPVLPREAEEYRMLAARVV